MFATDDRGACIEIDPETGAQTTVWDGPGGTMSSVPLPGRDGEFLASRRFFPGFAAKHMEIALARRCGGEWRVEPWMELPYVHRFDLVEADGRRWFLGCVLTGTEQEQADFENTAFVAVGVVSEDDAPPKQLTILPQPVHKNHGYCCKEVGDERWILTACEEGIFRLVPLETEDGVWRTEQLTEEAASDVTVCDLDGDGQAELVAIALFHGARLLVYHRAEGDFVRQAEREKGAAGRSLPGRGLPRGRLRDGLWREQPLPGGGHHPDRQPGGRGVRGLLPLKRKIESYETRSCRAVCGSAFARPDGADFSEIQRKRWTVIDDSFSKLGIRPKNGGFSK